VSVLVVGEAPNSTSADDPLGSTRYLDLTRFDRVNLLQEWPGRDGKGSLLPGERAKEAAAALRLAYPQRPLVLMGARVAYAFGYERRHFEWLRWFTAWDGRRIAVCPHPSGIVRWWNDPDNARAAQDFFDELDSDGEKD
jgi:uracil-DNA glycosylase